MNPLYHLDIDLDKKKYRDIFYKNLDQGQWHWLVPQRQELFWYQLFISDNHKLKPCFKELEMELNIYGLDNFPRFTYQFPNTVLEHHLDEDNMVSINLNLLETTPVIHIEHKPFPYEAAFINVGGVRHGVEKDSNERLILKFCLRHPIEEIYERLDKVGLLVGEDNEYF